MAAYEYAGVLTQRLEDRGRLGGRRTQRERQRERKFEREGLLGLELQRQAGTGGAGKGKHGKWKAWEAKSAGSGERAFRGNTHFVSHRHGEPHIRTSDLNSLSYALPRWRAVQEVKSANEAREGNDEACMLTAHELRLPNQSADDASAMQSLFSSAANEFAGHPCVAISIL